MLQRLSPRADGEAVKQTLDDSEQRIFQLARREAGKGAEPEAAVEPISVGSGGSGGQRGAGKAAKVVEIDRVVFEAVDTTSLRR